MRFLDFLIGLFGGRDRRGKEETQDHPASLTTIWSTLPSEGNTLCQVTVHTSIVYPSTVLIHAHDSADAYSKVKRLVQDKKIRPAPAGPSYTERSVYSSQIYTEE